MNAFEVHRRRRPRSRLAMVVAALATTATTATSLVALAAPAAADHVTSPMLDAAGCEAHVLPPNDDGSTDEVMLPFAVNFHGVAHDSLFVNNNGNVTFGDAMSSYTPFELTADVPPIIAPFLADVDTGAAEYEEPPSSTETARGVDFTFDGVTPKPVTYGAVEFAGRSAFCVNWRDVGYYDENVDKLNDVQLLLVNRDDRDPGDFDIYFNYGRVLWETGEANDGVDGFGGESAGAGYASGTGNAFGFAELPCSRINGACLDSNAETGLHITSTTPAGMTAVAGRHVFQILSGGDTFTGQIAGTITRAQDGTPVEGAWVQACRTTTSGCQSLSVTDADGHYAASQLPPGDYAVRIAGPGDLVPETHQVSLDDAETVVLDVAMSGPTAPPATTSVNGAPPDTIPVVVVGAPFPVVTAPPCDGVTTAVRYTITPANGEPPVVGELLESPPGSGSFSGDIIVPFTGPADVVISREGCPSTVAFNIYIDPSGYVRNTLGDPLEGATVTLLFATTASGPFTPLPDGDNRMAPSNRTNPDLTDATGHFGWDVSAGYYRVRAENAGCTSPDGSSDHVLSPVYEIPPPVVDIDLRLHCGETTHPDPDPDPHPDPAPDPAQSFSTAPAATEAAPLAVGVYSPSGGPISVKVGGPETFKAASTERTSSAGQVLLPQAADVSAPAAYVWNPLVLSFRLHSTLLEGAAPDSISVQRDGVKVPDCITTFRRAEPDPCLSTREVAGEELLLTVHTTQASTWTFAKPAPAPAPEPEPEPEPAPEPAPEPEPEPVASGIRSIDDSCPDAAVPPASFSDVAADQIHAQAIACMAWWKVTNGVAPGLYGGAAEVTRGQMASFLARALASAGQPLAAGGDRFADDSGSIHEDSINRLAAAGIVLGQSDGTYGAQRTVSRAQMASFLVRVYEHAAGQELPAGPNAFADDDESGHEASINKAAAAGFTGGLEAGRFGPAEATHRDQMASFLARMLDLLVEKGFAPAPA